MDNRCINISNPKVIEIAKKLNVPPAIAAAKISVWQDRNGPGIPTIIDLMGKDSPIPLKGNEELYARYDLLNGKGQIKSVEEVKDPVKWAASLSKGNTEHVVRVVKTTGGKKLLIYNKPDPQIGMAFEESAKPVKMNNTVDELFDGPISSSKIVLEKIANSNHPLKELAKQLLKYNRDIEIEIVNTDVIKLNGMNSPGVFISSGTGKIFIAKNGSFKYSTESTVLHEILHGLSWHYLHSQDNAFTKKFTALYNHVKANEHLFSDKYPLKNEDEFLVGIYTNPKFVNELKKLPPTNNFFVNLWEELLSYYRNLLKIDASEKTLFDEVFGAATEILEDAEYYNESVAEFDAVFSDESPAQLAAINSLLNIQGKQEQFSNHYTIEGFDTKLIRPSTIAKSEIQSKEDFKTEKQIKDQEMYTGLGTLTHDIQAEIIKRAFPEYNSFRLSLSITPDLVAVYDAMLKELQPIIDEAKANGDVLIAEVFVANLELKRGGTIDMLAITPEGKYRIYDLKNRFAGTIGDNTNLKRYNKLKEWDKQLNIYAEILEKGDPRLGIVAGTVTSSRVLENQVVANSKTGRLKTINGIKVVAPVSMRTENDKINEYINRLNGQIELLLEKEPKDDNQKEAWNALVKSKMDLMQDLQLRMDVSSMIIHGLTEVAAIEKYISDEENLDTTDILSELKLYGQFADYIDYDTLPEKFKRQLRDLQFDANRLHKKLIDRGKTVVETAAVRTVGQRFVDKLFAPIRDIGWFRSMVLGVSTVDNPLVATGFKVVTEALEKGRSKLDEFSEKWQDIVAGYKAATGGLDYSLILSDDKQSLIDKYTKKFWSEYYANRKTRSAQWARENLKYDEEAYNEAYQKKLDYEDSTKELEIKRIKAWALKEEHTPDDMDKYAENIYWARRKARFDQWFEKNENNVYYYFTVKDHNIDPKWKEIKEGKWKGTGVEKLYDFYTNAMEQANEIYPEKIKNTFIANFSQDFLERTSNLGLFGAIQGAWSELLNGLETKYDENLFGKVDPTTGEQLRELHVPGMSTVKQAKSTDLGPSLLSFMEGIYRYQELSQIEHTIDHVRYQIRNASEALYDSLGKRIPGSTRQDSKVNQAKQVSQLFDAFIDGVVYNKRQKDEGSVEIKGNSVTQMMGILKKGDTKKLAYAKMVDKLLKYTGLRNMSFNMYAPLVNALSGTANMYMTGAGGLYYSNKDLSKSIALITVGKTGDTSPDALKLRLILNWLKIDKEKVDRDIFKRISNAKLSKFAEEYNGMALMRESESAMVESGAGAMIFSGKHGVLFDDFEVKDGKLVFKKEFTDLEKATFKQKVYRINGKNIGSMNPDDIMMAKKWFVGRMIMQHRGWLPQMAYERFGTKRHDFVLDKDVEGRYRVAYRAVVDILKNKSTRNLTPEEIAVSKEAAAEATFILMIGLILHAMTGMDDEDKKEAWFKYSNKVLTRVQGELVFFSDPTGASQFQILLSPAASTSTIQDSGKLVRDTWREVAADMYDEPDKVRKKAKPIRRLKRALPPLGQIQRFLDDMMEDEE